MISLANAVVESEAGRAEGTQHTQDVGHADHAVLIDVSRAIFAETSKAREQNENVIDCYESVSVDVLRAVVREDQRQIRGLWIRTVGGAVLNVAVERHGAIGGELANQHPALRIGESLWLLVGEYEPTAAGDGI